MSFDKIKVGNFDVVSCKPSAYNVFRKDYDMSGLKAPYNTFDIVVGTSSDRTVKLPHIYNDFENSINTYNDKKLDTVKVRQVDVQDYLNIIRAVDYLKKIRNKQTQILCLEGIAGLSYLMSQGTPLINFGEKLEGVSFYDLNNSLIVNTGKINNRYVDFNNYICSDYKVLIHSKAPLVDIIDHFKKPNGENFYTGTQREEYLDMYPHLPIVLYDKKNKILVSTVEIFEENFGLLEKITGELQLILQ